jgi:hypothetical protein
MRLAGDTVHLGDHGAPMSCVAFDCLKSRVPIGREIPMGAEVG